MHFINRNRRNVASGRIHARRLAHRRLRIESLEARWLLTAFAVDTLLDDPTAGAGDTDGHVSLREAVQAANTNLPFGDAPAGEGGGVVDSIHFDPGLLGQTITLHGQALTISDDLSLVGPGAGDLTISAAHASRVFWIDAGATVEISAVAITDGVSFTGGGIFNDGTLALTDTQLLNNHAVLVAGAIRNAGALTVSGSVFSGNQASDGAAIWNNGVSDVGSSTFSGNTARSRGGGIWNGGLLNVADSEFSSNQATTSGGGIWNGYTLNVVNGHFSENSAGFSGGGIANDVTGTTSASGSDFSANTADIGGGIWNGGTLDVVNGTFSENSSLGNGGGIVNESAGTTDITDSGFSSNSGHVGGGVWNGGTLDVARTSFSGNTATHDGGGIFNGGTLGVINGTFSENASGGSGGGIANDYFTSNASVADSEFSANTGDTGGGLWNVGSLDVVDTHFSENVATRVGGGIANGGELHVTGSTFGNNSTVRRDEGGNGGAIGNTNSGTVVVADSTFTGNAAGTGGAIDNYSPYSGAYNRVDVSGSSFSQNSSGLSGGAIWSNGPTTIAAGTFSSNVAATFGGAIHIRFNTLTITGSTIAGNSATYSGGLDIWGADVEITDSTVSGNSTTLEGGAIENYEGDLAIRNSTISGNSTDGVGGGIWNYGTLEMVNATVVFNRANADGSGSDSGGGIHVVSSTSYPNPLLSNTILAGNLLGAPGADAANEADGPLDPASSHNLIGDAATSGGLIDGAGGNIVGNAGTGMIDISTVLAPNLADNGGPTLTHALIVGSLAIDAGDTSLATDADGNPLTYDQRGAGFARAVGGAVDIGAFEFQQQIVEIDVKPGDELSSINLASNGLIAVAIYTTADFNAADVDPATVQFAGAVAVEWALEDVDGDGDLDMILHFNIDDTNLASIYSKLLADDANGDGVLDSTQQTAAVSLTGETTDGQQILGTDEVDLFFSGNALRELLDQLALAGSL